MREGGLPRAGHARGPVGGRGACSLPAAGQRSIKGPLAHGYRAIDGQLTPVFVAGKLKEWGCEVIALAVDDEVHHGLVAKVKQAAGSSFADPLEVLPPSAIPNTRCATMVATLCSTCPAASSPGAR